MPLAYNSALDERPAQLDYRIGYWSGPRSSSGIGTRPARTGVRSVFAFRIAVARLQSGASKSSSDSIQGATTRLRRLPNRLTGRKCRGCRGQGDRTTGTSSCRTALVVFEVRGLPSRSDYQLQSEVARGAGGQK